MNWFEKLRFHCKSNNFVCYLMALPLILENWKVGKM